MAHNKHDAIIRLISSDIGLLQSRLMRDDPYIQHNNTYETYKLLDESMLADPSVVQHIYTDALAVVHKTLALRGILLAMWDISIRFEPHLCTHTLQVQCKEATKIPHGLYFGICECPTIYTISNQHE